MSRGISGSDAAVTVEADDDTAVTLVGNAIPEIGVELVVVAPKVSGAAEAEAVVAVGSNDDVVAAGVAKLNPAAAAVDDDVAGAAAGNDVSEVAVELAVVAAVFAGEVVGKENPVNDGAVDEIDDEEVATTGCTTGAADDAGNKDEEPIESPVATGPAPKENDG